jgi:RNA polymerase sigma factor (sigma-70 family)
VKTEAEVNQAVERYTDMIMHICLYRLKNPTDTQDICQNVFLKYLLLETPFQNAEHEKAWFIRVTINACKDHLKSLFRHPAVPLDLIRETAPALPETDISILETVLVLPSKYKDVIYLHYYEGYSVPEISKILEKKESTLYSLLSRGRTLLKQKLGGDNFA